MEKKQKTPSLYLSVGRKIQGSPSREEDLCGRLGLARREAGIWVDMEKGLWVLALGVGKLGDWWRQVLFAEKRRSWLARRVGSSSAPQRGSGLGRLTLGSRGWGVKKVLQETQA